MSSTLGNLSVQVDAGIAGYASNMDMVAATTKDRLGQAAASVDDFRAGMLRASEDMHRAAVAISSSMDAANDAIIAGSDKSAAAIENIAKTADKTDLSGLGDRIGEAIGEGVATGVTSAQSSMDRFVESSKTKAIVIGVALSAIFAAIGLGALYTAYKLVSAISGFAVGLLTGSSYKSENIDALIAANDAIKDIEASLHLTAQQASATNAAIQAIGVDKAAYIAVFTSGETAIRSNTDELDRLKVSYKDSNGALLPLSTTIQNVKAKLDEYTEGWDRNQAAAALGFGTYKQVSDAASVTATSIAAARDRLNDYNLGIGSESQAAVQRYQDAMRDFNREQDLTAQGFKRAWADQIMPVLTDFAEFFKDGFPSAVNGFRYSMAIVTTLFYSLKTLVYAVAESVLGSINSIGIGIGSLASAAVKALSGDFTGAKDELVKGWSDAKDRMALVGANIVAQQQHNAAAVRQAWAADDRADNVTKMVSGKSFVAAPKKETGSTKIDPFETDMNNLGRTQSGIDFVIANFEKFQGKVKESKAAMAEFDVTMGKYTDEQREQSGWSPLSSQQKADYIARNALIDSGLEKERQMGVLRKLGNATDQFVFKEQQAIDFRKQDIDWMGKSALELSKLTEARRIDGEVASMINQTNIELGKNGLKISAEQIASINARADAAKAAQMQLLDQQDAKSRDPWFNATESVRKYGEEAANTGSQIGSAITDGFKSAEDAVVDFATTGKLSFSSFATSVVADMVRIQARAAIAQASSGMLGSLFGSGSMLGNLFGTSSVSPGAVDAANASEDPIASLIGNFGLAKADGGYISGPGTGTSDSIHAMLSDGEFVINAASVKRNRALLEYLNNGGIAANAPHFASGGIVGDGGSVLNSLGGSGDVAINLVNQTSTPMQATASRNSSGGMDVILRAVEGELANRVASGQGALHKALVNNYGVRRTVA